jgi:hypothetical protein
MNEPLLERVPRLERSVRFWRTTSFVLAAILLSMMATGLTFFSLTHQRALRAMDAALQQELAAREAAEAARLQAERALQGAGKANRD